MGRWHYQKNFPLMKTGAGAGCTPADLAGRGALPRARPRASPSPWIDIRCQVSGKRRYRLSSRRRRRLNVHEPKVCLPPGETKINSLVFGQNVKFDANTMGDHPEDSLRFAGRFF